MHSPPFAKRSVAASEPAGARQHAGMGLIVRAGAPRCKTLRSVSKTDSLWNSLMTHRNLGCRHAKATLNNAAVSVITRYS